MTNVTSRRLLGVLLMIAVAVYLEGYCLYRMQNKLDRLASSWNKANALPQLEQPRRDVANDGLPDLLEIESSAAIPLRFEDPFQSRHLQWNFHLLSNDSEI